MPSQGELRGLFSYNPRSGILRHNRPTSPNLHRKKVGGVNREGYLVCKCLGRVCHVHRLVWVYLYGAIPEGLVIDHINRDRSDNRRSNLRLVTPSMNGRNANRAHPGVSFYRTFNRWRAYITVEGKRTDLGYFDTFENAQAARLQAEANAPLGVQ